ncbi:MAG TPA: GNVR domain-containing protein, partial [Candidatus Polarisedimenticolia bacterium]|nr:GNVR domain-containing protein [Candidatus Polarisedimenticolia bacterium]
FGLYPDLRKRVPREALIQRLRRDIRMDLKGADPAGGRAATTAFELSYRGSDPATVARVTNTLASFYVEEDQKARERQTTGTAQFVKLQLDGVKARLDEQERRVGEFKKAHSGGLPEQVEANLAALERLNTQLRLNGEAQIRAMERRDDLAKRLAEAGAADPAGDSDAVATRLARLKNDLADLKTRYSDRYPDVMRLQEEIANLEERAAGSDGDRAGAGARAVPADPTLRRLRESLDRADRSQKALQDEERMLRRSIEDYQRRVEDAPQREQDLRELTRDEQATKDLYGSLLKRYDDAQIAESMEKRQEGEQFRILDEAVVPEVPAGPNRRALIVAGLALSLCLAAAAVAAAEQIDTSFHTVGDLRSFTRVPVLVGIPRIVTDGDLRRQRLRFWVAVLPSLAGLGLVGGASYVIARHSDALLTLLSIR